MRRRAHQKYKAREMIDMRSVDTFKMVKTYKHKKTTSIPSDIWTGHLQKRKEKEKKSLRSLEAACIKGRTPNKS
eukprot:scaffold26153_cov18-Tisochrysis_lutea.AAC.1